jgi:hypothetical protein
MDAEIDMISQNEYRITIYSGYDPERFLFFYDGKNMSSPDFSEIIPPDGKYRKIKIIFKKDNQLWEITKELAK